MKRDKNSIGRILLIFFSAAGMLIMAYLLSLHFSSGKGGSFCDLGEGLSCELVNQSVYSEILGIPISFLGLLYFWAVLGVVIWRSNRSTLKAILFLSIAFLGPSLYLTGIELFVLKNICVLCETSKVLIAAIIAVSAYVLWPKPLGIRLLVAALALGGVLAGATYYIHASVVPSGKYNVFAQCLSDKGLLMYGSKGCSFCAKQRALFGDAVQYINEIECDPRYPNAEVERCVKKNIEHTPTWILEDKKGNELKRMDPGVQSLKTLSDVTGCPLPEN